MLTLVTLLLLTGLFEKLPEATLAAIVIAAVIELVDIDSLRRLWRVRGGVLGRANRVTNRVDFLAAAAALLGVLLLDTLPGLVIGIGVSLVLLIAHTSRPHVAVLVPVTHGSDDSQGRVWVDASRNPGLPAAPGVVVVRVEAPLALRQRRLRPRTGARPRGRRRTACVWWCWTARRPRPST